MAYDKQILSDLLREMEARREARSRLLTERRQEVYDRVPRIRQIDETLRGTAAAVLRAALETGDDPTAAVERLREQNLALQRERVRLLTEAGLPADFLDDKPDCPLCGDNGYVGAEPCTCLKTRYAKRLTEQLSTILPIADQNFEAFRLDYYSDVRDSRLGLSPRENMEANLDLCAEYAHHFSAHSPNLLLFGSAGLGKTFLSTCIAKTVSERGASVAYDTAIHVLGSYETVKFPEPDIAGLAAEDVIKLKSNNVKREPSGSRFHFACYRGGGGGYPWPGSVSLSAFAGGTCRSSTPEACIRRFFSLRRR